MPVMKTSISQTISSFISSAFRPAAPVLALLLLGAAASAHDDRDCDGERHGSRPPRVPVELQVPAGNELQLQAAGVGVQIYVWTQSATDPTQFSWVFKAPHAILLHHREDLIGIHYAGPSWQGNDGSKVVGSRVASSTVDPQAIPWLLLKAASNDGVGIFADTTYIQRLETSGGLAPTTPGSFAGQEALVPYIAEYFFYRAR